MLIQKIDTAIHFLLVSLLQGNLTGKVVGEKEMCGNNGLKVINPNLLQLDYKIFKIEK